MVGLWRAKGTTPLVPTFPADPSVGTSVAVLARACRPF
jgi:hypothetical protein